MNATRRFTDLLTESTKGWHDTKLLAYWRKHFRKRLDLPSSLHAKCQHCHLCKSLD